MKYLVCLSCLAAGFPVLAQTTFQEQAARLQNINAFLQDFRPGTAPERVSKNRLELAFELYPQPDLDTRVGRKDEPIDPPSVVPRVRARYLLKNGLFLGGSAVPGIEFQDYDADTVAAEVGYRFKLGKTTLQLRASYSDGDITGPITEIDAKLVGRPPGFRELIDGQYCANAQFDLLEIVPANFVHRVSPQIPG